MLCDGKKCGDTTCTRNYTCHVPEFIFNAGASCEEYQAWLNRKIASVKSAEKKKGYSSKKLEEIQKDNLREAIHEAVKDHGDRDFYTGEKIKWHKINDAMPTGEGWAIRKEGGDYPSPDHFNGTEHRIFRICSLRVNWAKAALTHEEFVDLCKAVVKHDKSDSGKRKSK